jgi:hypothetical protein
MRYLSRVGTGSAVGTRSVLALLLLLLPLTACNSADLLGPGALHGIEGIALRGPTCPVHMPGDACADRPHQARIEIRSFGGGSVTSVRSGEDGRFRVGLRPGRYILVPESGDPFPNASEQEVVVMAGVYTQVTVSFDTGIR